MMNSDAYESQKHPGALFGNFEDKLKQFSGRSELCGVTSDELLIAFSFIFSRERDSR